MTGVFARKGETDLMVGEEKQGIRDEVHKGGEKNKKGMEEREGKGL